MDQSTNTTVFSMFIYLGWQCMKTNRELFDELKALLGVEQTTERLRNWLMRSLRTERKRKDVPNSGNFKVQVEQIIADLNSRTGLRYRTTKDTQALIRSRFNDGFTVEDFFKVHEIKCKKWLDNDNRIYLRPSTLYRPSKFEGYLQEWNAWQNELEAKKQKKQNAELIRKTEQLDEYNPAEGKKIVSELLQKIKNKKKMQGVI